MYEINTMNKNGPACSTRTVICMVKIMIVVLGGGQELAINFSFSKIIPLSPISSKSRNFLANYLIIKK